MEIGSKSVSHAQTFAQNNMLRCLPGNREWIKAGSKALYGYAIKGFTFFVCFAAALLAGICSPENIFQEIIKYVLTNTYFVI